LKKIGKSIHMEKVKRGQCQKDRHSPDKNCKAAILKMFQQVRAKILEMNRKIESLNKEIREV